MLADEPTGNLDTETANHVLELLQRTCGERNATLIVATHGAELAARAARVRDDSRGAHRGLRLVTGLLRRASLRFYLRHPWQLVLAIAGISLGVGGLRRREPRERQRRARLRRGGRPTCAGPSRIVCCRSTALSTSARTASSCSATVR